MNEYQEDAVISGILLFAKGQCDMASTTPYLTFPCTGTYILLLYLERR